MLTGYMLGFGASQMFADFDITDDVAKVACFTPTLSCPTPHIKTFGYVGYALVVYSIICRFLFGMWLKGQLVQNLDEISPSLVEPFSPVP